MPVQLRIDAHGHGDPDDCRDPKGYVEACRERGIEGIVLIETFETCRKAVEKFGDFVIPVAWKNRSRTPAEGFMDGITPQDIEECIQSGCKGIKFLRPSAPYSDERYWPLYEKVEELNAVAVFHTGYLGVTEREERPVRMEHMRAAQIEAISRRFTRLKILMAHFSNPWWEEAWKVSFSAKNVFADLSGGTALLRSTRMWAETFAPDGQIMEGSLRKLCFASDTRYFRDGEFPFELHIEFYQKIFDRIGLPAELRDAVNRRNVERLFRHERRP